VFNTRNSDVYNIITQFQIFQMTWKFQKGRAHCHLGDFYAGTVFPTGENGPRVSSFGGNSTLDLSIWGWGGDSYLGLFLLPRLVFRERGWL
jgi:hypothetical protein